MSSHLVRPASPLAFRGWRRRLATAITALSLATVVAACGSDADPTPASAEGASGTDSAAAGPVSATDDTGTEISLDQPAERIVCLDAVCLDMLKEMDLRPVASTQEETFADEAFFGADSGITTIGGSFFEPDLEAIIAAQPDLVLGAASVHAELRSALGSTPIFLASIPDAAESVARLRTVATLVGREDAAEEAITRYEETLAAYGPQVRETPVLSMYGGATDDIGIDAGDSSIGQIIGDYTAYPWPDAGEGDSGFLEINLEQILDVDPAWIWVLDFGFDPDAPPLVEQLADEPVWRELTAVQQEQVVVTPRWWGGTRGTHTQQLVLDTVMPAVFPEEFPEPLGPLAP